MSHIMLEKGIHIPYIGHMATLQHSSHDFATLGNA